MFSLTTSGKSVANDLYRKGARTFDDLRQKDFGLNSGQMVSLLLTPA